MLKGAAFAGACLLLGGCVAGGVRLGPPASAPPDDATVRFCADFGAAGGDASTVGPLPLSAPRNELEAAVTSRLAIMGDLEPPDEIEETWHAWRAHFVDVREAIGRQPSGLTLDDDDVIQTGLDMYPQSRIVRDFYLTNCG